MRHIYGPVHSRRLGKSLGVNITPGRVCNLDCIYCEEARPTVLHTLERKEYAPAHQVIAEIREATTPDLDYITFSGSGEPTLHLRLGEILQALQDIPVPKAVITNSGLLHLATVREELQAADLVVPSLDAVSEAVFQKLNRPCPQLSAKTVIAGLREFSANYSGQIWLEVLLVKGVNDSPDEVKEIAGVANTLKIDKVQLNTISRATTVAGCQPVLAEALAKYANLFAAPTEIYT